MKTSSIDQCKIIELPKISDSRGNLTYLETGRQFDFSISRVYYIYDIPGGSERGGHAHKNLYQLIIAVSGSFEIIIDDGIKRKSINLSRGYQGLILVPYIWRELVNFSSGAVCLVIASDIYRESDYLRSYDEFMREKYGYKP